MMRWQNYSETKTAPREITITCHRADRDHPWLVDRVKEYRAGGYRVNIWNAPVRAKKPRKESE